MVNIVPGEPKTYLSVDNPSILGRNINSSNDIQIGVPIILLRNIDQPLGVCNGKRLINIQIENYVFGENVISRSSTPSDPKISFTFQRKQMSIVVSSAKTINTRNLYKMLRIVYNFIIHKFVCCSF
ncbi:hypothetical protein MTR_5g035390 [Medicago truncatula]|uniref:DNA helicase Pif1-like 2B domain-containing protein n=1 Tax=Medicago truncatula TaxID=3880 RepID=G7K446_MEDTR|nr:hypothetical protein MTR_5g035390 [Medicago truncatula]